MEIYVVWNGGVVVAVGAGLEYVIFVDDGCWKCALGGAIGEAKRKCCYIDGRCRREGEGTGTGIGWGG